MDINQFLLALRARRKAFVLALLTTIVAAIAVALVVPKRYTAQATLVVDSRDEQAMTPTRVLTFRDRASYIATQIELIQSGRVAARVARDLKLAQKPEVREAFERDTGGVGPIDAWIGDTLLQKLKVLNPEAIRSSPPTWPTRSQPPTSRYRSSCARSPRARRRPGSRSS
jgi:uncharacterized protein involved in exopolysaccharide biosynthesis